MRCWKIIILFLFALLGFTPKLAAPAPVTQDQEREKSRLETSDSERIVTRDDVKKATNRPVLFPLRILSYPHRAFTAAMEKGLVSSEQHYMRQRIQLRMEDLRSRGIVLLFGGLGEGTGFGGGSVYSLRLGKEQTLQFLGRGTFKGYEELDLQWTSPPRKNRFVLEGAYQWRPQENFYGLGQHSRDDQRTSFSLRQTWAGPRWEYRPLPRLRLGTEYRHAWLSTHHGKKSGLSSPDEMFPGLTGFGTQIRLRNVGMYLSADGVKGEYDFGGMLHLGASYQHGLGNSRLRYFTYEIQSEGRLPVAEGRSVLVGQASIELNRERGGSDPIPFFLRPHIGGSSTLRGFALDRFYGKNILLATLEYRYGIHPSFQIVLFFDEGQMFDRTSELNWLNWHRTYGFGLRMRSARGTQLRLEFGWSEKEGFTTHLSFGERERRPLGGPVRYGTYRR